MYRVPLLFLAFLLACSAPTPSPPTPPSPTPDLQATVDAAVAAALPTAIPLPTPDIEATVSARMEATIAAMPTATSIPTPTPTPTATPTPDPAAAFATMIERVRHSVVRVEHTQGSGSGVIFEATDGGTALIVTNAHVIEGYTHVDVTVNDSTQYRGTVRGVDATRDLAVVTICCRDFRAVPFGSAEVGEEIVVMGYALGLFGPASVSRGIVSAIRFSQRHRSSVIQTDAAMNPGNSGGPMFNLQGEVVGINTFSISETVSVGSVEGINFAVAADSAQRRVHVLKNMQPPTPTPVPPTATPKPTPTPDSFGPSTITLPHDSDDFIEVHRTGLFIADMQASGEFVNPHAQAWSYGIFFRDSGSSKFWFVLDDTPANLPEWNFHQWSEADGWELLDSDISYEINQGAGAVNSITVVAEGDTVKAWVNRVQVITSSAGGFTAAGGVGVGTGIYFDTERAGSVTQVHNFQVRPR